MSHWFAPSGSGKGAAEAAAADALDLGAVEVHSAGSGEGLLHLFAARERGELVQHREALLLSVPEVDVLTALTSRQGATLLPLLRSAWSGERIGFGYADPTKALALPRHSYRLGMIVRVQPGRAAPLLDDSDGGTPQRFVWLPTTDPAAPDTPPSAPPPLHLPRHDWTEYGKAPLIVPDAAAQLVDGNRTAALRGATAALDGHALLCRLRAAQGLAVLDGRKVMNTADWNLAGVVMAVSSRTRSSVRQHLTETAAAANRTRGSMRASVPPSPPTSRPSAPSHASDGHC